jgi:hypothetical protein
MSHKIMACVWMALLAAGAGAVRAGEECPLTWHLSADEGIAEAKAKNRPVVMVFPETGVNSHNWFAGTRTDPVSKKVSWTAVDRVTAADVVLVKVAPPGDMKLPVSATPEMVAKFQEARKKLFDRYNGLCTKYGVTVLPAVVFLSPDGETVLWSFARPLEGTVLSAMRHLPQYLYQYQRLQAVIDSQDPAKIDSRAGGGALKSPLTWHMSMAPAVAEAKGKDRPILAVFTESQWDSREWFGYDVSEKDCSLDWSTIKEIQAANVVLAKIAAPTEVRRSLPATAQQGKAITDARAVLLDEYGKLAKKYGVLQLPGVLLLSPDGETVIRSHVRTSEKTVLNELKKLPQIWDEYKQVRDMLKQVGGDKEKK